jgi:hypothetical protein
VRTDERVKEGESVHLIAFEIIIAIVYQIREHYHNEEVREAAPADDAGVLETDGGRSHDVIELARVRQKECPAHIQRTLSKVLAQQQGTARAFKCIGPTNNANARMPDAAVEVRHRSC